MAGRTATVTVLFTDVVGSTARLAELGETQGREVFDAHHRLLSTAIDAHGGEEAKWLGDGVMAVFASAADAVRCAIDVQRRTAAAPAAFRLEVRAGLALGEATRDGDDWFGTPVVTASRLCGAAGAGEILCPELVATLLAGFDDLAFGERGPLELKGLPKPVMACDVRYQTGPTSGAPRAPLVGRAGELRALQERLAAAADGHGGIALLVGEPGIGKTRLAEEVADEARHRGFAVAWGRCLEEAGAPTLWPWLQALRDLAAGGMDAAALAGAMGHRWPVVVDVLPELAAAAVDAVAPPALEPDAARFRLFDALTCLVRAVAAARPLVVVLDDLHWADATSLRLLEHVGAELANAPVLVVGTYRDVDVGRGHPLAATLGVLARAPSLSRHPLDGLDDDAVAALATALGGADAAGSVAALQARTDGNPFFVSELVRLVAEGGVDTVPEGVRDVIGRRLDRLSADANSVLAVASIIGRDVDLQLLGACVELDEDRFVDAVDAALAAGLLRDDGVAPGRVRFSHALIREALVEELSSLRRVRLHRRVADALAARADAGRTATAVAELAHHRLEAAVHGDVAPAVEAALAAADDALSRYGYEEADAWYDRALQALDLADPSDDALRARVLIRRGGALRLAGRVEEAKAVLVDGAALAADRGDVGLLAAAALGVAGPPEDSSAADLADLPVVDEAIGALDRGGDDPALAMLLARKAVLLVDRLDPAGTDTIERAVAMARRCGDDRVVAYVLRAWHRVTFDPFRLDERVAVADELIELGRARRDLEVETWGRRWRLICLAETSDVAAFDADLDELQRLAGELRQPFHEWGWVVRRGGRALINGRVGEAEELSMRALGLALEMGTPYTTAASSSVFFAVRWWQGRLGEIRPLLDERAEDSDFVRPMAALTAAVTGDAEAARGWLDRFDVGILRAGSMLPYLPGAAFLAEASARLGDEALAAVVVDLFSGLGGRMAVAAPGVVVIAPVDHALGIAWGVLGDRDRAVTHFQTALAQERSMGAAGLEVRTTIALAGALVARGDRADARRLLDEGRRAAEAMGAFGFVADADRIDL